MPPVRLCARYVITLPGLEREIIETTVDAKSFLLLYTELYIFLCISSSTKRYLNPTLNTDT